MCAPCLLTAIEQLETAITQLKGGAMMTGVENLGLHFSVTRNKWHINNNQFVPGEDVKVDWAAYPNLTDALIGWCELRERSCETMLRRVVYDAAQHCNLTGNEWTMPKVVCEAYDLIKKIDDSRRKEDADDEKESQNPE